MGSKASNLGAVHAPQNDPSVGGLGSLASSRQKRQSGGSPLLSPWHREHVAVLTSICERIAAAVARGEARPRVIRRMAAARDGRRYRSKPSRRWRLSYRTLRRLYVRWVGHGGSAFALGYRPPRKVPGVVKETLWRVLLNSQATTWTAAFKLLPPRLAGVRPSSAARTFTRKQRLLARRLFKARRELTRAQEALKEVLI